ncbi:hypothetical protein OKW51_004924 [Pseudomonas hunanensis]|nr:hypothetical protein [Pseudomonas hunanensis]
MNSSWSTTGLPTSFCATSWTTAVAFWRSISWPTGLAARVSKPCPENYHHQVVADHRHVYFQRLQVRLAAALHGDTHLHVALAAILVEVDDKGRCQGLVDRRWLDVALSCFRRRSRLALVHEEPGRTHRQADCEKQRQHQQQDQLEFAFSGGVFHCVALRHANNPSSIGVSKKDDVAEQVLCQICLCELLGVQPLYEMRHL